MVVKPVSSALPALVALSVTTVALAPVAVMDHLRAHPTATP